MSAIKYPWGEVVTGKRHYHVIHAMAERGIFTRQAEGCVQGFVGSSGKFYDRDEAKSIAVGSGQIPAEHAGTLYSEDLWPPTQQEQRFKANKKL